MKASRARGLFLVVLFLSWSVNAEGVPPGEVPPPEPEVPPTDSGPAPPPADVPLADAQEQYDQQAIGFDDFGGVVTSHGTVSGTVQWSSPYQGKYKRPLVGVDFYRAVGRSDLVKQYEDRAALKTGLMVGGGLAFLAGVITANVLASNLTTTCPPIPPGSFTIPSCTASTPDPALAWIAVGGILAGGVVFITGAGIDPDPVGTVGKRQLAEAYNGELWQRLTTEPHADGVDVHVVPQLVKDGAGVSVAVRF